MSRDALVAATRRAMEHARNGTTPLDEGVRRVPVANYLDDERWRLEVDRIFHRVPLVLGFSCELPAPHSYKACDVMGVPVLITRGDDGELRAFVNMCSHRGAIVVEEGTGSGRRFSCPYHAWTYDGRGDLVGILDRANFGEIDMSCHGLTPLPVGERAGIIFGGITPGMAFDLDAHLGGYTPMLASLGLENCTYVGKQVIDGPNWKICYDGYLDFYHLPILHKNTFGPAFNNRTIYDAWGPHQRLTAPDAKLLDLDGVPTHEWPMRRMNGGIWTIFPHISIASFDADGRLFMVSQLFPGPTPGTSTTTQHFLAETAPDEERRVKIDKTMDFLLGVVRDEDYFTGLRIQRAARTGAKSEFVFGRNEGPCQRFHEWTDRLVAAETPADTMALFATAEEYHQP